MRTPWVRRPPGAEENRKAAGAAFAVGTVLGAVVFYFARIVLARERIDPPASSRGDSRRAVGRGEAG